MKFKQRIHRDATEHAVGLEVHVEGWGDGPFFTVRGFDATQDTVLLSTRYSKRIKYRVQQDRVYFTKPCAKNYARRLTK